MLAQKIICFDLTIFIKKIAFITPVALEFLTFFAKPDIDKHLLKSGILKRIPFSSFSYSNNHEKHNMLIIAGYCQRKNILQPVRDILNNYTKTEKLDVDIEVVKDILRNICINKSKLLNNLTNKLIIETDDYSEINEFVKIINSSNLTKEAYSKLIGSLESNAIFYMKNCSSESLAEYIEIAIPETFEMVLKHDSFKVSNETLPFLANAFNQICDELSNGKEDHHEVIIKILSLLKEMNNEIIFSIINEEKERFGFLLNHYLLSEYICQYLIDLDNEEALFGIFGGFTFTNVRYSYIQNKFASIVRERDEEN